MSQFQFLKAEWPLPFEAARKAEEFAHPDPRTACFYARRSLELLVQWLYKHDSSFGMPYSNQLSSLLHTPKFRSTLGDTLFAKAKLVVSLGNNAVHSTRPVSLYDSIRAVRELFHLAYWVVRTYAQGDRPHPSLVLDESKLPKENEAHRQTAAELLAFEAKLREKDEKLTELLLSKSELDAELVQLREEVAWAKAVNQKKPDTHDYGEAETRSALIDFLLSEAGWTARVTGKDIEFPVNGMPNASGEGLVDYVLWGDDGKPLALVEAKRTTKDALAGQQQATLYADCLEKQFSQRPVIFCSNGYEHFLWNDTYDPQRSVQGFYRKDELELLIQRRTVRKELRHAPVKTAIVERYYQDRAIRKVAEDFEAKSRKALLVMATGSGKTRTVIALTELLMRCNWAKRVLFLADRKALVKQAAREFTKHLPDSPPVNLLTNPEGSGRVYVSTYPTMMGLIEERAGGTRRFGVGYFDLVVIDEAHRSVFQKYRAIFEYFDALLIGLTATPKAEIDRNTYDLFDLEKGVPTDAYDLDQAVKDGYLVPMRGIAIREKFLQHGITYDELSEEEQEKWDALEWDEGGPPAFVDKEALNSWLFNIDTVDKVLEHLMSKGLKVSGGDVLGKTIIFAKNRQHARFIEERFNANYPELKGKCARVITHGVDYVDTLIDEFSKQDSELRIAISVDMLDTGIDVPEVVNLVFFKMVRSKTKFWQMLGRGTRLCKDLFGPGQDKAFFYLFDWCGNLEFFRENPPTDEGSLGDSVKRRVFVTRARLVRALDDVPSSLKPEQREALRAIRDEAAELLRREVEAMNVENFIVRPKRKLVEQYKDSNAWAALPDEKLSEVCKEVAGLPSATESEPEETRRFDVLLLNLQLSVLRAEPRFKSLKLKVQEVAQALTELSAIPMVASEMSLIQDVAGDEWWRDVTVPMLEQVRQKIRLLVRFIEKSKRTILITNFETEVGGEEEMQVGGSLPSTDLEQVRRKARAFLTVRQDHVSVQKLKRAVPLSPTDLQELEKMLVENGVARAEDLQRAAGKGLGLFIRSLVGLDSVAVREAFSKFISGSAFTARQHEFIELVIEHLTYSGSVNPSLLYESPFSELAPEGPQTLFSEAQVSELISVIERVNSTAVAA
ncbi:DEAD/DEAH box helicase family protein [Myxococcus sp. K38C18041901]|uniref:DEAD/DEAH box helicase family protein n=1 Tax=Myxococcus guangdongensis TaxID=2906760 RepID=UPI0020A81C64|nr:DEAD/DEAH box helicase family protein [Myxococcus guangdongensis]MCP3065414.1 DEAD/DEAH box helicase family protein [Myxococcus guangdongensis]